MQGFFVFRKYLGADSNCHTQSGATPSRWCVYQFRHLGILYRKNRIIFDTSNLFFQELLLIILVDECLYNPIGQAYSWCGNILQVTDFHNRQEDLGSWNNYV